MTTIQELQKVYNVEIKTETDKKVKSQKMKDLYKKEVEVEGVEPFKCLGGSGELSFKNTIFILKQGGDEDIYGGFKQRKEQGRIVKKGEKGMKIYFPSMKKKKDGKEEINFFMGTVFGKNQTQEVEA